jgi:hypothetical protein
MPLIKIDPNYNPFVRARARREGESIKRYSYPILAKASVEIVVEQDQSKPSKIRNLKGLP